MASIGMDYVGSTFPCDGSLKNLCREKIYKWVGNYLMNPRNVRDLDIPRMLKEYLRYTS